jgi:hypothetical protein
MENFNAEDYNIPRLMKRLKQSVYPGLANLYVYLIKKEEPFKTMLEREKDEKSTETYISYATFKLQKHIIDKVGNMEINLKPSKTKENDSEMRS